MKIYAALAIFACVLCACTSAQDEYKYKTSDLSIRDPFVFVDRDTNTYYIQSNRKPAELRRKGEPLSLCCFASKDLKNWKYLGESFRAPKGWWGKRDYWAPDMFKRNGKYYIIATFSCDKNIGKRFDNPGKPLLLRACAALVSDRPEGPYAPVSDKPLTPENMMALDGTLYEEDGRTYLVFCQEWLQVGDGKVMAVEIAPDLSRTIGEPVELFRASTAPWVRPLFGKGSGCYVTDAPVIKRADDGTLYMTWSSRGEVGGKEMYVIGLAYSDNGKLLGKWNQFSKPLNGDDGGHAMVFTTLCGKTKISYHAPNSGDERVKIRDFSVGINGAKISE